jgi:uncharacterized metal-binding protein
METENPTINTVSQSERGIVLACSGGSDLGELSDKVARKLRDKKVYNMKCLAMVAAHDQSLLKTLQTTDALVIDGCGVDCGKKIMEEAWLSDYCYIRLSDFGYQKGQTLVTDELAEKIYSQIVNLETGNKVVHNKPMPDHCCNEETCDMFEFMSEHVGLKILHPGGMDATKQMLSYLKLHEGLKVLDIACGKGRT